MKLTDKQFMNLLEDLVKEVASKKEVLLESPKPKKTIREKMRERKSGKA
jgi:hypothetical protein